MHPTTTHLPLPTTHAYGAHPSQQGELHLPAPGPHAEARAAVCLLHGGFWRLPHGRDRMDGVARDLALRGHVVWNLGYRRVGESGGGWPGTFDDVRDGIDHLHRLAESFPIDLDRVVTVGHSAGGHLALWHAAGRHAGRVMPRAVAGLAPVTDLELLHRARPSHGAVRGLMGATPEDAPGRYEAASPARLLPLGRPMLVVHGLDDHEVPREQTRGLVAAARAAGDAVDHREPEGLDHMAFLDPASRAHGMLGAWLSMLA